MRNQCTDGRVAERPEIVGLPIIVEAVGHTRIEHTLVGGVGCWLDQIDEGVAEMSQWSEDPLSVFRRAGIADGDNNDGAAVEMRGQEGCRRRLSKIDNCRQLLWRGCDIIAVKPEYVTCLFGRGQDYTWPPT